MHCAVLPALVLAAASVSVAAVSADDLADVRARLVAHYAAGAPDAKRIRATIAALRPDGTWPDVNYTSRLRGAWPTYQHVHRLLDLARAYAAKGHPLAGRDDVREAFVRALGHWTDRNYQNPNWWYGRIGVPLVVAPALLLMGDAVPADLARRTYDRVLAPSKMGMTGQNKVWVAGIALMKALLREDRALLATARDAVFSELHVTTAEGIQPDASFHQHGPQQQWGNYGAAFGGDMVRWAAILGSTSLGPTLAERAVLREYLLEGPSWIVWRGRMDVSGCGRQLVPGCQASKGRAILGQLASLRSLDASAAGACDVRLASRSNGANALVGHKHYWRSDIAVHRRPTWYASVKMSSTRTLGSETCNSENLLGLHLGDGAMYVLRSGREYDDIYPVWDWRRLPGTTCRQGDGSLVPSSRRCRGRSDFVGGASDGRRGVAAMEYLRDGLRARKAWFFLDDRVICLGAGITCTDAEPVLTSLNQCRLAGPVELGAAGRAVQRLTEKTQRLEGPAWAYHDGIGYALPAGSAMTIAAREQAGDWDAVRRKGRKRPARMGVFSAWIDHGRRPGDAGYAYAVFPQAAVADMPALSASVGPRIVARSAEVLAVSDDGGRSVLAAFFAPGTLTLAGRARLTVDAPCVAILDGTASAPRLHLADPTHKLASVTVRIDGGAPRRISLPTGPQAGRTTPQP